MATQNPNKKIRLLFQDEAGFGRINKPKNCWCTEGIRPSVPCHHIREYRYVYGAVDPMEGEGFFLIMPYCNTECIGEQAFAESRHLTFVAIENPDIYIAEDAFSNCGGLTFIGPRGSNAQSFAEEHGYEYIVR